ncbi:MAG: hypothetical protein HDR06_03640 [Lachnospiraceae bacterium]|nr:hypothetical protein [Lachnospiraceae bacterium]
MADTVRVSDYGCIPDSAIIVGIIGSLDDQFRFAVKIKGISGVFYKGRILFSERIISTGRVFAVRYFAGFAQTKSVYINSCDTERLLQIEQDITASCKMQTPCCNPIRIFIFMK